MHSEENRVGAAIAAGRGIKPGNLVLLRHGESAWNEQNRFAGWIDVDLTDRGRAEARQAAQLLRGRSFDIAYTSVLKRAIRTLWIVLDELDLMWIPIERFWRLNERHYGALQGMNKAETASMYGETQVHLWRRSYDIRPPALPESDPRYPGLDPRYQDLDEADLPLTECLKDTVERLLPYWKTVIGPTIKSGKKTIIVAHGNSLRALVKRLDGVSDEEIGDLNIPTGIPLVYELGDDLRPITHYYLGDQEAAAKAAQAVADQGKAG